MPVLSVEWGGGGGGHTYPLSGTLGDHVAVLPPHGDVSFRHEALEERHLSFTNSHVLGGPLHRCNTEHVSVCHICV